MRAARPRALVALAVCMHALFAGLIFARLGTPLLWQDEAETAMFGRSVLEFGIPKVHVGRNVLYGAPLPLDLGRNEALDVYVASPWAQYYFAAPAVAWSDRAQNFTDRTWRVRLPFALAGWLGVLLLGVVAARLWPASAGGRAGFWLGYGIGLVLSTSLQLHLREVRYYPLVVLALGLAAWLESRRLRGDLPALRHALLLAPILFGLFNLFYPAFAAVVAVAVGAHGWHAARARSLAPARAISEHEGLAGLIPYAIAAVAALPVAVFFQLPAQSREFFALFSGPRSSMAYQLGSAGFYLLRFEFLAPVAIGAVALAFARRQIGPDAGDLRGAVFACDLALALAVVWVIGIARTPLFFSRYVVPLAPVLCAVGMLQIGCLVALRRNRAAAVGLAAMAVAALVSAAVRAPELRGRFEELREPYRGPLDHVIPYLAARYPKPADLVIATNFEDFSYMFYLGATVTVGYFPSEPGRDFAFVPDVIIPRTWKVHRDALQQLAQQGPYVPTELPVANVKVNNLPELSPRNQAHLIHRFHSPEVGPDGPALVIGEREQP
jgi:hypothetical protein